MPSTTANIDALLYNADWPKQTWDLYYDGKLVTTLDQLQKLFPKKDPQVFLSHPGLPPQLRKEIEVNGKLKEYTAHTYAPGHHPNQYVKGKPKSLLGESPSSADLLAPTHEPTVAEQVANRTDDSMFQAVQSENDMELEELAKKHSPEVTVEQEKQRIEARMKSYVDNSDLAIRIDGFNLAQILEGGHFQNQLESGDSNGAFDPDLRVKVEQKAFGVTPIPKDEGKDEDGDEDYYDPEYEDYSKGVKNPDDFPKYGYADNHDAPSEGAGDYGPIKVVLKDEVKDRATVTFGDSLSYFEGDKAVPDPFRKPSVYCTGYYNLATLDANIPTSEINDAIYYVEAQIHGRLDAKDIARIEVYDGWNQHWDGSYTEDKKTEEILRNDAKKLGIPFVDMTVSGPA